MRKINIKWHPSNIQSNANEMMVNEVKSKPSESIIDERNDNDNGIIIINDIINWKW